MSLTGYLTDNTMPANPPVTTTDQFLRNMGPAPTETLQPLHTQLTNLFNNANNLQQTINKAKAAGTDLDD